MASPLEGLLGSTSDTAQLLDESTRLADDMLAHARDALLVAYRFLNRPSAALPARTTMDRGGCATDGREALFAPGFVLAAYGGDRELVARAYLHMMLHCLLRHPFPAAGVDPLRWTVACDLAVGCIIEKLECPAISVSDEARDEAIARYRLKVEHPTADAFYAVLAEEGADDVALADLDMTIGMDAHDLWARPPRELSDEPQEDDSSDEESSVEAIRQMMLQWQQVAQATEMDMARDEQGSQTSSLRKLLRRPGFDDAMGLDELIAAYAAPRENMAANPDEFDNIYYTYGLSTLGNVALIEPLEQIEQPVLRDFFVAIDTSGSVDGPLVEAFVRKACGLLAASAALGPHSRVRIIQCDCAIQDETVCASIEDVRAYLEGLELKGFGGTDFRPVFERIDQLVDSGEAPDPAGLIYFTDGEGTFPETAPTYDTAFVFVNEAREVPAWATSVLTYSDELMDDDRRDARHEHTAS